jgi:mRNA interferase RelE/StbE
LIYEILFAKTARDELEKLENSMQKRIVGVLERIRIRPESYLKRLTGVPYFRLRVGDYRLILDLQKDKLIILVVMLGHRKNIYDKI